LVCKTIIYSLVDVYTIVLPGNRFQIREWNYRLVFNLVYKIDLAGLSLLIKIELVFNS
jgi:hypothetical protein